MSHTRPSWTSRRTPSSSWPRLLVDERSRRGTRDGTRALGKRAQAVLTLRWFLDDTRMSDLAHGNGLSLSTAYSYKDEAVEALAARRPSLPRALLAAKAAGYTRLITDGTLIHTDRISTPTAGVNLW